MKAIFPIVVFLSGCSTSHGVTTPFQDDARFFRSAVQQEVDRYPADFGLCEGSIRSSLGDGLRYLAKQGVPLDSDGIYYLVFGDSYLSSDVYFLGSVNGEMGLFGVGESRRIVVDEADIKLIRSALMQSVDISVSANSSKAISSKLIQGHGSCEILIRREGSAVESFHLGRSVDGDEVKSTNTAFAVLQRILEDDSNSY